MSAGIAPSSVYFNHVLRGKVDGHNSASFTLPSYHPDEIAVVGATFLVLVVSCKLLCTDTDLIIDSRMNGASAHKQESSANGCCFHPLYCCFLSAG
jgi:hypothetical protein